jgi:hypothetical protein
MSKCNKQWVKNFPPCTLERGHDGFCKHEKEITIFDLAELQCALKNGNMKPIYDAKEKGDH